MPYISKGARERLRSSENHPENVGELTYLIVRDFMNVDRDTNLVDVLWARADEYLEEHGRSYQTFAEILGAVTGVRYEWDRQTPEIRQRSWTHRVVWACQNFVGDFYAKKVAAYEDEKIRVNGGMF